MYSPLAIERKKTKYMSLLAAQLQRAALPLAGWAPSPVVRAEHVEWVDPFRGGMGLPEGTEP